MIIFLWLFLVNNNYIDIPLHHLQPFLHGWKYDESMMHSHIMVLRMQILHQCWLCWCSMHVRRYEVLMFYDTCWIISPCRPSSSHNVHQYISCNIGATFRSIDVTEHRCYVRRTLTVSITLFIRLESMIWVLRCPQYPTTVICTSQFTYWWWGWWQWWW